MSARPAKRSLTCAETAKLVRKALKADFPGTKFSVRSSTYAGGASITVGWTDGPRQDQVDGTLGLYSGATFDGMQDLKEYHDTLLMTDDGPKYVHMGADFVIPSRDISSARRAVYRHELRRFLAELGVEWQGDEARTIVRQMGYERRWFGEKCPGSPDTYCKGCGRWQKGHEKEPPLR
jgi:hypothetical protein